METLAILVLVYLAIGVACFGDPGDKADPSDASWHGQVRAFADTLPAILTWPPALWHLLRF